MRSILPKPIIARVLQTWRVPPGFQVSLVDDLEGNPWVVESCPAGTQFWTLDQASDFVANSRSGRAFTEAVALGRKRYVAAEPSLLEALIPVLASLDPLDQGGSELHREFVSSPIRRGRKTHAREESLVGV